MVLLAALSSAWAVDPVIAVDYPITGPAAFEDEALSCKRGKRGLRCRSDAWSRKRGAFTVFGPHAGPIEGSYTVELDLQLKWGGSAGVAFGLADGRWSGVFVRQDTEVWAGAWDGAEWVTGIDWHPLLRYGPGPHHLEAVVRGDQVRVTVDGRELGTYTSPVPLAGEVAPLAYDRADVTFVALRVWRIPE